MTQFNRLEGLRMMGSFSSRVVRAFITVALIAGGTACSSVDSNITDPIADDFFDPSLGIDFSLMNLSLSGLFWQDIVLGNGAEAVLGATATVQLSGWLPDGTLFDQATQELELLPGVIIAGLLEGVLGMRVGGARKLVLPAALAWGSVGNDPLGVPPNSAVVFDVVLEAITLPQ